MTPRLNYAVELDLAFSTSNYWKKRPSIIKKIMFFLEQGGDSASKSQPLILAVNTQAPEDGEGRLALAAKYAAKLHYIGLAALFCRELDLELHNKGLRQFDPRYDRPIRCMRSTFDAYVLFAYGNQFIPPFVPDYKSLERLADHVESSDTCIRLASLWEEIARYSPVGPLSVTEVDRMVLTGRAEGVMFANLYWHGVMVDNIFREKWRSWYIDNFSSDQQLPSSPQPSRLELIIGASGIFATTLTEAVECEESPFTFGRLMGQRAIAHEYDFDEWTPLMGGQSLRIRADAFFDSSSVELAKKHELCNSRSL